ncbi:MAG: hypothetical protein B6D46_02115 [Polyangiaceae bacterium UTPRO1]|nr:MAG: hypothetical protein B6D46_02115 [Polyangiaceae bacterium UTPRO1]
MVARSNRAGGIDFQGHGACSAAIDCADVPYANFRVIGTDPHNFETDGDGLGCEPYRSRWRGRRG